MRVLIVRLDHLGDVLLTTPLIRAAVNAGHETHVLVRVHCAPPIADNPRVTLHTIEEVAPGFPAGWRKLGAWMGNFDMILLPYAKPWQLLLASAVSGVRRRIAMWGGLLGRLTLHECLRSGMRTRARHFAEIPLDCARAAGFPIDGLKPDFFLTGLEIDAARAELAERFPGMKVVGIHPGCAGNTCNLPPSEFGSLAALLLEEPGIALVGTGIPAEKKLFETWPAEVLAGPRFYDAGGQWDLRKLAAHVANFATMVVPSTGPLHIAAAFAIPTVSPFCQYLPVSAVLWGNLTPGTINVSPPAEFCHARRKGHPGQNCDFEGRVTAADLKRAVLEILAKR